MSDIHSDAFVFFGATGDLAYKKIFPATRESGYELATLLLMEKACVFASLSVCGAPDRMNLGTGLEAISMP